MSETLYFAYGSTINRRTMARRCPEPNDAKVVEPAVLDNYELVFRQKGPRTFGMETIRLKEGRQVQGLLWRIKSEREESLDIYHWYPYIYEKQEIILRTRSGKQVQALVYIMPHEQELLPQLPTYAYYSQILEGFRQNGLPEQPLKDALTNVFGEMLDIMHPKARTKAQSKRKENFQR